MVAPLVWGVFVLGSRLAASKAGQAAAKFVVRKLTGKAAKGLGKPLSSHTTSKGANTAAKKLTDLAGKASDKRKYGATMAATEVDPLVKEVTPILKGLKNFDPKPRKYPNIRPTSKSMMKKGGVYTKKKMSMSTKKRKK